MKAHAEATVSDVDFAKRAERWPVDTPDTKEGYYIREIFESKFFLSILLYWLITHYFDYLIYQTIGHFPTQAAAKTAVRWVPRGDWGCSSDPSGRSVSIHNAAYTVQDDWGKIHSEHSIVLNEEEV